MQRPVIAGGSTSQNYLTNGKRLSAYYYHLIHISKRQYYNDYFIKNTKDTKLIWKGIKQIIILNSNYCNQSPTKIIDNHSEITDTKSIANAFCKYFADIGDRLASSIPNVIKSPLQYLNTSNPDSFFIFPVTATQIEIEIASLKAGKACGPSSIPITALKLIKQVISKPLEILFNASFSLGIVPNSFKVARVIPVFKKARILV